MAGAEALESALDALYQLAPGDFVAARDALARELRGVDRAAAQAVKRLSKPPLTAWALNRAVALEPGAGDELLAAAEAIRVAQGDPDGAEALATATAARARAVARLRAAAVAALEGVGSPPGQAQLQRLQRSLHALAAWPPGPEAPRLGRLSTDVDPPGFDQLAALLGASLPAVAARVEAPAREAPSAEPRPDPLEARRAEARRAVDAAEREWRRAETDEAAAGRAEAETRRQLADAETERARLAAALIEAEAVESEARRRWSAESEAYAAARRLAETRREAHEAAVRALERADTEL
jgi:hypothetical protein